MENYECLVCGEEWQIKPGDETCGFCGYPVYQIRLIPVKTNDLGDIRKYDQEDGQVCLYLNELPTDEESFLEVVVIIENAGSLPLDVYLDQVSLTNSKISDITRNPNK